MCDAILVGNSFPMSLIRREVCIRPVELEALRKRLERGNVYSFWGHRNTLAAASAIVGVDLTPRAERPAIQLSKANYPQLESHFFKECWLLSPQYTANFRPSVGEEVDEAMIKGWQVLKMEWV